MLDEANGLYYKGDEVVSLTAQELKLLSYFINRKGQTVPLINLTTYLYGEHNNNTKNRIRECIFRLNKKIKNELIIYARIGIGYKLIYLGKRIKNKKRVKGEHKRWLVFAINVKKLIVSINLKTHLIVRMEIKKSERYKMIGSSSKTIKLVGKLRGERNEPSNMLFYRSYDRFYNILYV